jgi:hypothetical protein
MNMPKHTKTTKIASTDAITTKPDVAVALSDAWESIAATSRAMAQLNDDLNAVGPVYHRYAELREFHAAKCRELNQLAMIYNTVESITNNADQQSRDVAKLATLVDALKRRS